ncbi:MAG: Na(+)/H(+) antiporter subunit B [Acidobacteriota bacterium]
MNAEAYSAGGAERRDTAGMTVIVKTVTRLTVGLIFLYGCYIVLHGHLTPGGGFVGGIILALSFVHLALAFGREAAERTLSHRVAGLLEGVGALLFVSLALLGLLSGVFFRNFLPAGDPYELVSAGFIPLANLAICLKVGAGLFSVFLALVFFRFDWERKP